MSESAEYAELVRRITINCKCLQEMVVLTLDTIANMPNIECLRGLERITCKIRQASSLAITQEDNLLLD
jgi:hypothetical protein